jgi:hypothetical protein
MDNEWMVKQGTGRNPLFAKRWFADEVIIQLVRWYLRFRLSYRDMALYCGGNGNRGGTVDNLALGHTIHR